MKHIFLVLISTLIFSFTTTDRKLFSENQKTISKSIKKLYEVDNMEMLEIQNASSSIENSYFELYNLKLNQKEVGYLYVTEAPSKVETFTYMIVFNKDLTIKYTEVLQYRENYGVEICSKRFLKQFVGKSNGENLEFNKDIDGVSGATISSHSISKSVKKATLNVVKLKSKNII